MKWMSEQVLDRVAMAIWLCGWALQSFSSDLISVCYSIAIAIVIAIVIAISSAVMWHTFREYITRRWSTDTRSAVQYRNTLLAYLCRYEAPTSWAVSCATKGDILILIWESCSLVFPHWFGTADITYRTEPSLPFQRSLNARHWLRWLLAHEFSP